jgi:hypothetical protein
MVAGRARTFLTAVVAMSCVAALAPGLAHAAVGSGPTTIASPNVDQVVGTGEVRVVLRSRASRAAIDGHDITGLLERSNGAYRATVRLGHGIHYGVNELVVRTAGQPSYERVQFIVAHLATKLLTLGNLQVGGGEAPVRVTVRAARGTTLQAFVNGKPVTGAFHPEGHVYVGRLGANDALRAGRNRLVVLTYKAHPTKREAVFDAEAKTFKLAKGRLLAGAGEDKIVEQGDFVRLDGTASNVATAARARAAQGADTPGTNTITYHWEIVSAPDGSNATLDDPSSPTPSLEPDLPGDYLIQLTATAPDGTTSTDTVTVTVRADVPPIGAALQAVADDRGTISLNGQPVANTTEPCDPGADGRGCNGRASWAIWNRQTLDFVASGNATMDGPGMKALADLAGSYNKAPTYLMVVNLQGVTGAGADAQRLFKTLGVADMSSDDYNKTFTANSPPPVSVVGVPGSPAGSAFLGNHFLACGCVAARHLANMSGYLRLNPVTSTGDFEFVFTDQVEFDTNASTSPSQITMKVGDQTYAHDAPADGSSGFYMVRLDSLTLAKDQDFFYVTNAANGAENPAEAARMAGDLASAAADPQHGHGEQVVLLQAFGTPKGTSKGWGAAAQAIEKLGGTRQVFDWLNQGKAAGLEAGTGRYALVGRSAMIGPGLESSQALTGGAADGRLHGLLARARDVQYQPLLGDPYGTINFDLVNIVNRPTLPDGGFPKFTPGQAAAAAFLGRDPDVLGVCDPAAPTCDVRKAYYKNFEGTDWANNLTRLGNDATKAKCAKGGPGTPPAWTPKDCDDARQELELEIGRRNAVETYFGPTKGLQAPFGAAKVAALVDIGSISEQIKTAVQPPPASNATSHALNIVAFCVKIAGIAGVAFPPAAAAASGVGAAFGLAAYLTKDDGSPDLIGPLVTKAAANLGSDLFDRYQKASAYFTTEAKIIMSDFSKMSDVAAVATSSDKWKLGDIATSSESMRQGTKAAIYQSLIPVAWPVLYDLGTGITHAPQWICRSHSIFLYDKNLFQNTPQGAEIPFRFPETSPTETHLLVVGGPHTVGNLHSAYVPAPPDSLTGPLFRDPTSPQGGIGLHKLDFYSSRFFRVFSPVLQQTKPRRQNYGYHTCQSMPDPPGNSG